MRLAAPSAIYKRVGQAISSIRLKRKPRKMSQGQLAAAVGVSRASIANIEQGRHRIQMHVLYDIAAALDLEPHDLLPHLQGDRSAPSLPEDISNKLRNPKEASAVSRLIAGGKGEVHDKS
jgi:transcriptional regulator with XRE-family HTH domain